VNNILTIKKLFLEKYKYDWEPYEKFVQTLECQPSNVDWNLNRFYKQIIRPDTNVCMSVNIILLYENKLMYK